MQNLLQNLGILVILIAVGFLAYAMFKGTDANTYLAVSGALLIIGLLAHILINKYFIEE